MNVIEMAIPNVKIIEPNVFGDERGFSMETWPQQFEKVVTRRPTTFVQDNYSRSTKDVLRDLHYQTEHQQGKLVRVISGKIFDVAVDIRKYSPTFCQWVSVELSAENKRQLWIPAGFAHGFYVARDEAEVIYKCTDYYHPETEISIRWDDCTLNIHWPEKKLIILSVKDNNGIPLDTISKSRILQ